MNTSELKDRFAYYQPSSPKVAALHGKVREACLDLAEFMNDVLPESREKSLVMTHIENVMFNANAVVARQQVEDPNA